MTSHPPAGEAHDPGDALPIIRTLPLMIVYALGFMSITYMPVWVGVTASRYAVAVSRIGLIGSCELAAVALASILTAAFWTPGPRRSPLAIGLIISVVANLFAATAPTLALFTWSRIGAGLANGFLLAEVNGRAAAAPAPSRVFAGQLFVMVVFAVMFFSAAPRMLAALGPGAPFFYCATAGLLALASLPNLQMGRRAQAHTPAARFRMRAAAVLLLGAATLLFITLNSVWPYLGAEATKSGVSLAVLSRVLAAGAVANLLAPVLAELLGRSRVSHLLVVTVGIISTAVCIALITATASSALFMAGALLSPFFLIFLVPFYLTFLVKIDASGRFVAASAAFFMIGSALGPGIGGIALKQLGMAGLSIVGIATPLLALLATWSGIAGRARAKPVDG